MDVHEGQEVLPENFNVAVSVHGRFGGEEEEATPDVGGKATPHHDRGTVLDGLPGEAAVVPVVLPCPHPGPVDGLSHCGPQSPAKQSIKKCTTF